ncbi:MAG TPA: cation diffusion facilitator family transporter [Syntrophales bacterium]|jgi:cation diffusion facilitator family transporter|nr:cation diffusion facilitator family transporter [Syntrophales bacterium]HON23530.1 cation diffusion facilitator family transporter [Syntrophales bacterium]HOU77317.1 cation diffusion facilitator family transporter [Syntrophales bacterium]HPC32680.1 cation diffusion facilitator family transporter [Syntrophales bacterium]HQG33994.1 cation diffusion facilitator family transporter [Syntrophales bacterium]
MKDDQSRKEEVALLSVASNTVLVIGKLAVGVLIGSVSIISEAIHSGVDLLAAGIALFSVKTSHAPADSRHPFGHGKIENISGTIEALLIFAAAVWIIVEAVKKLTNPEPIRAVGWGVGVMLVSAAVNFGVSQILFKVGRETDSIALQADAWHLRTDVYTSAGVMVGLALIWMASWLFPERNFYWLDPVVALVVALLIMKAAYDLTTQAAKDLLDVHLPRVEVDWIRQAIRARGEVICGFHDLRTRKAGHFRFVEFHLKVDPGMTVRDSHAITKIISAQIKRQFPATTVTIHVEPCDGKCDEKCFAGCLLGEEERRRIREARTEESDDGRRGGDETRGLPRP